MLEMASVMTELITTIVHLIEGTVVVPLVSTLIIVRNANVKQVSLKVLSIH